jgi:hypothetical protein
MELEDRLPRTLTAVERGLLLWVLPEERQGYGPYRKRVESWFVQAQGKRGAGHLLLGPDRPSVDEAMPLAHAVAYGLVTTNQGKIGVTVHELRTNQLDIEFAAPASLSLDDSLDEVRRWTLSTWKSGQPCPACGAAVREVTLTAGAVPTATICFCAGDRRTWVHDGKSGMTLPIPVTNFYNELMVTKKIRDSHIALDSRRLFTDLGSCTDEELGLAFLSYNRVREKVPFDSSLGALKQEQLSFLNRLKRFLHR